jgi:hypothetical protein
VQPTTVNTPEDDAVVQDATPDPTFDPWHDHDERGRLPEEVPFRFDLRVNHPQALQGRLGLPPVSQKVSAALNVLVANLWYARLRGAHWVFYSRDRVHYATMRQAVDRCPTFYTRTNVINAVDVLEAAGLIEHWKTAPSPYAEFRSRVRATPALIGRLGAPHVEAFSLEPTALIILRDADGQLLPFAESRDIGRLRRDVEAQNAFIAAFKIEFGLAEARCDESGVLRVAGRWFNPLRRSAHRVFNGNFSRGGRWYGTFWQGLPKAARGALLIDGAPTVELDFRACHLRLLAAMAGVNLPFDDAAFDPFCIRGVPRRAIKLTFNIMLNASSKRAAHGAVAEKFRSRPTYPKPGDAMAAVAEHFPRFERFWNTGIGLRLQNLDAKICARVQRTLRQANVPVLSVHDSFIVRESEKDLLEQTMNHEMGEMCSKLREGYTQVLQQL